MSAVIRQFKPSDLPEMREIFFESSLRKDFKDETERELFFQKYLGYYLKHYPDLAFVAFDKKVLGYVVGALHSDDPELEKLQPHLNSFRQHFLSFPSHLHINCHHEARGQGIGRKLVLALEDELKKRQVSGLHIMTSPDAANKNFYSSLGFHDQILQDFRGVSILLMGKAL